MMTADRLTTAPMNSPLLGLSDATGAGVGVAVVDSGWSHRLDDHRVLPGVGLVDPDDEMCVGITADDDDRIGHGTACADLILRLAPAAEIIPVRVFGKRLETSVAVLVAALDWAADAGIHLINLSLGTLRNDALRSLYAACERARRGGVVIVAAHPRRPLASFPAVFDNVISVSRASGRSGPNIVFRPGQSIEVLAPDNHRLRCGNGTRRVFRGSSFAAPVVTGVIARFMERHPAAGIDAVRALLATFVSTPEPPSV